MLVPSGVGPRHRQRNERTEIIKDKEGVKREENLWEWVWEKDAVLCRAGTCRSVSWSVHQFSSVQELSPNLCDPMNRSTPGLPAHHQLPEFTQTHAHRVGDAIQPSHPLLSPSPLAFNLSQHQGLFKWVSSLHQVAKVLEFQLQHQSFQWIFRTDLLRSVAHMRLQSSGAVPGSELLVWCRDAGCRASRTACFSGWYQTWPPEGSRRLASVSSSSRSSGAVIQEWSLEWRWEQGGQWS